MFRIATLAAASSLLLIASACAQTGQVGDLGAQDHANHAGRSMDHSSQAAPTEAHGDHHANFESGRFHVRVSGTEGAPDIILIPGLSSSPHVFDDLDAALGSRYRLHALHIQGFAGAPAMDNAQGDTPSLVAAPVADELARYIRENNIHHAAVIGHSMGGTIAMMLAARHPDLVGRLMVVDMVPFMGAMFAQPGSNPTVASVQPVADQMYAMMANSPREAYQAQSNASITGMINTESRRAGALRDSERSDQKVSSAAFRELIITDLRPELPAITAPTTVLYVKFNDPRMTNEITDGIYRASFANLPGATLTRIDDSAHFIMYDQPGRFEREVEAFLAR